MPLFARPQRRSTWISAGFAALTATCTMLAYGTSGWADSPAPRQQDPDLAWSFDGPSPELRLSGLSDAVFIEYEVSLDVSSHRWTEGPFSPDRDGLLAVVVAPPADAFLHASAEDYMSDLWARVDLGNGQRPLAPPAYIGWPDGPDESPALFTELTRPDNGVFRDDLRPIDIDPGTRLMPFLGQPDPEGRPVLAMDSGVMP